MPRFFIEVSYRGSNYAGFQIQKNANSVQAEIEKALQIFFKTPVALTGSSRTDAGVHAFQNYFHTDTDAFPSTDLLQKSVYNVNAILPADIVVKRIFKVADTLHCRFNALQREYQYFIYQQNPAQFYSPFL